MCVSVCLLCASLVPRAPKALELQVVVSHLTGCCEVNPGPAQKRQATFQAINLDVSPAATYCLQLTFLRRSNLPRQGQDVPGPLDQGTRGHLVLEWIPGPPLP